MSVASDFAGLYQWLVADSGGISDLSGNGHHATVGGAGPSIVDGLANGHDAFSFDGTSYLNLGDLSALTSGEVFIVVATKVDPPTDGNLTGIARIGTNGANDHYTWVDGNIYNGFGSTNRYGCGNPTPDLSSDVRVLNVHSATNDWGLALDGTVMVTSGSNTAAFTDAATLGKSIGSFFLVGYITEYILYSAPLSSGDRADLTSSLMAAYQGAFVPPGASARVTAAGLSVLSEIDTPIPNARVTAMGLSVLMLGGDVIVGGGGASRSRFYLID